MSKIHQPNISMHAVQSTLAQSEFGTLSNVYLSLSGLWTYTTSWDMSL